MDISTTSNPFICLAEAFARSGIDMEDTARALATAFKAVVAEGIGTDDMRTISDEFLRLCRNKAI